MILEYDGVLDDEISLIFFYASWNSNCNIQKNLLFNVSSAFPDLKIYRLNTTKFHLEKKKYSINKIPSYIICHKGNIIGKYEGTIDQYSLINWVKNNKEKIK